MPSPPPDLDVIFSQAIELRSADARTAYLADACGPDAALRRQVESLVAAHFRAGSFLDRPAAPPPTPTVGLGETEAPGTLVGPYKLLEVVGEGGMGVVYVAEQAEPVRRRVAVKLIKPGMDTQEVVARFEAERQALALMDHPNIARVFDAGATAAGRPYFVMELVRGLPITDYCDGVGLPPRDRLRLFAQVCRAVQHAHMKGVIHRDLKPTNVLVTLHDGLPVPKVIDFGVAKAVNQSLTDKTVYTRLTQLVGTPLYMAPEQAELSGLDVDTRADVYSLGVLLYELLTGTTPFDREALRKAALDEVRRIIREVDPPRPSDRVSTLGADERSGVSGRRGLDDRRLVRLLRGDLDWVAMRALEKDRERRYDSAGAFAADVERFLADEAVEARSPSAWYRLRKAARRNRPLLVTAGLVAAALLAGTAVSVWQAVRATAAQRQAEAAERRATDEAAVARAVNDFLQLDLLRQVNTDSRHRDEIGGNPDLTVKEALDRAAAKIGTRFQDKPLVEAAIRSAVAEAYGSLGRHSLAVPHIERALAVRQAQLGPDHQTTLDSMNRLATIYSWLARYPEAIALKQKVANHSATHLGPDHPETLAYKSWLADVYKMSGQHETSITLYEELLDRQRAVSGPRDAATLSTAHNLAQVYAHAGRLADSLALHETALNGRIANSGPDHESTIWPRMTYAQACQKAGELDRADRLLADALVAIQKQESSRGWRMSRGRTLGWMAYSQYLRGRYAEAEVLIRESLDIQEREHNGDQARHFWSGMLGAILTGRQRYAEAEPLVLNGYEGMNTARATQHIGKDWLATAGGWVVRFYEATNQPEKVRAWRQKLADAGLPVGQ